MGSIEKIMVAGILVIICVILGIAIWGAQSLDDPTSLPKQERPNETEKLAAAKAAGGHNEAPGAHDTPDLKANEADKKAGASEPPTAGESKGALGAGPGNTQPQAAKPVSSDDPLAAPSSAPVTDSGKTTNAPVNAVTDKKNDSKAAAEDKKNPNTTAKIDHHPDAHNVWQYTVKKGDTYSSLGKALYGKANAGAEIARMNEDIDERALRPGQILNMPPTQQASTKTDAPWYLRKDQPSTEAPKAAAAKGQRTYVVRDGDTLTSIARAVLGRPDWNTLYELNRTRLTDPKVLKAGQEILLPAEN